MSTDVTTHAAPASATEKGRRPQRDGDKPARLVRRKKLLLFPLPVVLAVLLLAAKLLSLPVLAGTAQAAYGRNDGDAVVNAGNQAKFANAIEPFTAYFNSGDGYALKGDFGQARMEFSRALELAPPDKSCLVRVNLVLTLEKLGDAAKDAGNASGAKTLYDDGVGVVSGAPQGCFAANSDANKQGEGSKLQDAKQRLEQKSQTAVGQTPPQAPAPGNQAPPQPDPGKMDQLQQQQKNSQQERSNGQQLDQNQDQTPTDPNQKRW